MDPNYNESSKDEDTCWKRMRIENALIKIEKGVRKCS